VRTPAARGRVKDAMTGSAASVESRATSAQAPKTCGYRGKCRSFILPAPGRRQHGLGATNWALGTRASTSANGVGASSFLKTRRRAAPMAAKLEKRAVTPDDVRPNLASAAALQAIRTSIKRINGWHESLTIASSSGWRKPLSSYVLACQSITQEGDSSASGAIQSLLGSGGNLIK
jgi:hypothetical protein